MKGYLSEEALASYAQQVAEQLDQDFAEGDTYDFTRCVRPNGSAYGTGGQCRKGEEVTALEVLQSGIKGRVPRDDPKEPLAGGSTPLEKGKEKLKLFEQKISDPSRTPTERELEQFGRLKMAVEEFENKKDGGRKGLFGRQDKSDLDESKSRELGKETRKLFPKIEDRQAIVRAKQIHLSYLRKEDPLLRKRSKATTEEILKLEQRSRDVSNTRVRLEALLKNLPKTSRGDVRRRIENILKTVKQAEDSYGKAVKRLNGG
jgi:SNF2 family DNA or RNA helicase